MAFTVKRRLYESMPLFLKQGIGLVPFPLLAGKTYRETLARQRTIDAASREDLLRYQERALGELLDFATSQVPAYRPYRSTVERLKPLEALKAFPFTDKSLVQANLRDYCPENFEQIPHYEISTGGTSGNQLKLFVDDHSQAIEMAFMHRMWERVGYSTRARKATFRGVTFGNLPQGVYWQHNPVYREVQFSPFNMSEENLPAYVEMMIRFKPSFLHGYPSALDIFAEYILRHELTGKLAPIHAVFLGSEGSSDSQKDRISRAFRTRVLSWYGHSERLILAGGCEKNDSYHHFPDYGILEIANNDGDICTKVGERGELIGTGLLNRSMVLIRYRTGDYATRAEPFCECGRHWDRIVDVEGRWKQDMIVGRDGAKISLAALNMHGPLFERVIRYQYYQDRVGECELRIMTAPEFTEQNRKKIEEAYCNQVGEQLKFTVREVENIELTDRGKLKMLESKL